MIQKIKVLILQKALYSGHVIPRIDPFPNIINQDKQLKRTFYQ